MDEGYNAWFRLSFLRFELRFFLTYILLYLYELINTCICVVHDAPSLKAYQGTCAISVSFVLNWLRVSQMVHQKNWTGLGSILDDIIIFTMVRLVSSL